jgi:hypothetical protein
MDRVAADLLPKRELTEDERQSVEDVLDAALAVKNKQMTVTDFMRLGTAVDYQDRFMPDPLPSPAYTRWLATGMGSRSDPRWQALQRILDWTVRKQHVVTHAGVMSSSEIHEHDEAIRVLRATAHPVKQAA